MYTSSGSLVGVAVLLTGIPLMLINRKKKKIYK
jgi:LPXTG-motif cell wall-anchored protein